MRRRLDDELVMRGMGCENELGWGGEEGDG